MGHPINRIDKLLPGRVASQLTCIATCSWRRSFLVTRSHGDLPLLTNFDLDFADYFNYY